MNQLFFTTKDGREVYKSDFVHALEAVGAADCDVLCLHTEMNFGFPATGLSRQTLLGGLWSCIDALNVPTVIFPTFTFSFCNREGFDPENTKTKMGIFNEYVRANVPGMRSKDPLLSVYVVGEEAGLAKDLSSFSIGEGSHYDKLHRFSGRVKFLFFGADMDLCFTYLHFVEERLQIPFRYNREFTGKIIEGDQDREETWTLFVRYSGTEVLLDGKTRKLMTQRDQIKTMPVGDSQLLCFDERPAYKTVEEILSADSNAMLVKPFDPAKIGTEFGMDYSYSNIVSV